MSNSHTMGPQNAALQVKTYREGMAQKVGHDLILDVTRWAAQVQLNGASSSIMLECDSSSLQVREGVNGVKPLSDKDREEIVKTINEKILRKQPIRFRSTTMEPKAVGYGVQGELAIGSESRPVSFDLKVAGGRISGIVTVGPHGRAEGPRRARDRRRRPAALLTNAGCPPSDSR